MNIRLLIIFSLFLFVVGNISAKKKETLRYDIVSAGSGTQGTYLVKVYVYSMSSSVSDSDIKHAAVHGVIFRGFNGTQGNPSQRPMAQSVTVEQEKSDYFNAFFGKEGAYLHFATVISGSYERIKTGKEYKVGAVVQVNKDNLRRELEQSGIIKSLSNGF